MAFRTRFTTKKRDEFLELVREGHTITFAARAVNVSRRCIYDAKAENEQFAALLSDALEEGGELLEEEARRRAQDGVRKPIYNREGKLIDTVWDYSDTLLIFLLKGRFPEKYKDRGQQEIVGKNGQPIVTTIVIERPPS